jgi:hypothetical protein
MDLRFALRNGPSAVAFGMTGPDVAIAFDNGNLVLHNCATKKSVPRQLGVPNCRNLLFCDPHIFGISQENSLFRYSGGKLTFCPYSVKAFSVVNKDALFILGADDIARVVAVDGWHPVSKNGDPPNLSERVVPQIVNHPLNSLSGEVETMEKSGEYLWFKPDARFVWMSFRHDVPMFLKRHFAAGDAHDYDTHLAMLNSYVASVSKEFQWTKAFCELFADQFPQAAFTLCCDAQEEVNLELNGGIAGCIIACENEIGDRLRTHLKSMAIALFAKENYTKGAMFLRISRLDRLGADYLIDYGQTELAMKFVRLLATGEKEEMLLKLGLKLLHTDRLLDAMMLFMSCRQYHVALYLMTKFRMPLDVFFIKKYLTMKGLLQEVAPDVARQVGEVPDLTALCAQIDGDFASKATKLGLGPNVLSGMLA